MLFRSHVGFLSWPCLSPNQEEAFLAASRFASWPPLPCAFCGYSSARYPSFLVRNNLIFVASYIFCNTSLVSLLFLLFLRLLFTLYRKVDCFFSYTSSSPSSLHHLALFCRNFEKRVEQLCLQKGHVPAWFHRRKRASSAELVSYFLLVCL